MKMKGIIIYQSNYGSTEQYAKWISDVTGFEIIEQKNVKTKDISKYDTVIMGAPIFASTPLNAKWIEKKWDVLKEKKLVLYTTSGAPGNDPLLIEDFQSTFPEDIHKKLSYFPLGGRIIQSELNLLHKILMYIGKKIEKDPQKRSEMNKDKDHVDRKEIAPLLEYVQ